MVILLNAGLFYRKPRMHWFPSVSKTFPNTTSERLWGTRPETTHRGKIIMTTTTPIPTWPTSDHLTVLPIERADQAVEPHRLFRLLILSRGKLTALLDGEPMEMNAPCVLCLHERRRLTCTRMIHCEGLVLLSRLSQPELHPRNPPAPAFPIPGREAFVLSAAPLPFRRLDVQPHLRQ